MKFTWHSAGVSVNLSVPTILISERSHAPSEKSRQLPMVIVVVVIEVISVEVAVVVVVAVVVAAVVVSEVVVAVVGSKVGP